MTEGSPELEKVDVRVTGWMARNGLTFLRVSLAVVFLWFGVLKFFPGLSPASELVTRTFEDFSGGRLGPNVSIPLVGALECVIGLGLLFGFFMRVTLALLGVQMLGTLLPVVLLPEEVFTRVPYALTLEGQFIVKNAVLISAALVLGATVRGGGLVPQPEVLEAGEQLQAAEPAARTR